MVESLLINTCIGMGIVAGGWMVAWHWKIKHIRFIRKLLDLDEKKL